MVAFVSLFPFRFTCLLSAKLIEIAFQENRLTKWTIRRIPMNAFYAYIYPRRIPFESHQMNKVQLKQTVTFIHSLNVKTVIFFVEATNVINGSIFHFFNTPHKISSTEMTTTTKFFVLCVVRSTFLNWLNEYRLRFAFILSALQSCEMNYIFPSVILLNTFDIIKFGLELCKQQKPCKEK